jgi:hypothetical protein
VKYSGTNRCNDAISALFPTFASQKTLFRRRGYRYVSRSDVFQGLHQIRSRRAGAFRDYTLKVLAKANHYQ